MQTLSSETQVSNTEHATARSAMLEAVGESLEIDALRYPSISVQLDGTFTGTVQFEVSNDGDTWLSKTLFSTTGATATAATAPGMWTAGTGARFFRVRVSALTDGAVGVHAVFSTNPARRNASAADAVAAAASAAGSATAAQTARTGAEAARDLALAGQFAGAALGTADLNTVTTPGVYRQGTTGNATLALNYPIASQQGVLEVFHSTATSSIFQRYMQTTGTASGKGHWQRRYTSSAWSAWAFTPTQRVDQTAGRVIYTWDNINNREQLIYGDTGWRDITASMGSIVTGGSVFVRRYGATVFITLLGVTVPISGTVAGALPIGFRIAHAVALPTPYGSITTWDTNGNLAFSALGTGRYVGVSFLTGDTWPTTPPGTPVGSIPNA